jgi:hypothetical protein
MLHTNATLLPNSTLGFDNYASHVGQTFFDQSLISAVDTLAPYSTNTQPLTTNAEDSIMAQEAGTAGVDPVMEYTLLGDTVEEGLFAWLAFGVDSSKSEKVSPAVWLGESGGLVNTEAGVGGPGGAGGGGAGGPGGSMPGGSMPTGEPTGVTTATGVTGTATTTATGVESAVSSSGARPGCNRRRL